MAVHPNYFISGIWKSKENKITHFFLHQNMEAGFKKGDIKTEKDVLKLLEAKFTIQTLVWNYEAAKWIDGVEVKAVRSKTGVLIRSFKDNLETDHLDKLINMRPVMIPQSKFFI